MEVELTPEFIRELNPKTFYILRRKDNGDIFYVGCTNQKLKDRLRKHRAHKTSEVSKIMKLTGVSIEEIYKQHEGEDWQDIERSLIEKYRLDGHPLVNLCEGGIGAKGIKRPIEQRMPAYLSTMKATYIKNIDTGEIKSFDSVGNAAKHLSVNQSAISKALIKHGLVKGHLVSYTHDFIQSDNSKRYNKS